MNKLNEHQEKVANHYLGRAIVLSVPGSGKTSTITSRIGFLIKQGVKPESILQITFTNKAAKEMRDRAERYYGEAASKVFM